MFPDGVTGFELESGAREETGRFRDVKRCVATGDRTQVSGISLLRHNRQTTAAWYHRYAPQSFWRVSGFRLHHPPPQRSASRSSLQTILCYQDSSWNQRPGRRQEDSGTSKDVSRAGIKPGPQELASCAITARPQQHDTTEPRHRAFELAELFQGSCYRWECWIYSIPIAWPPIIILLPCACFQHLWVSSCCFRPCTNWLLE